MKIDAEIDLGPRILLDELSCKASAAATEVEDRGERLHGKAWEYEIAAWVVEGSRVGGADELPEFERRYRQGPREVAVAA
jgi:hypothetical protein